MIKRLFNILINRKCNLRTAQIKEVSYKDDPEELLNADEGILKVKFDATALIYDKRTPKNPRLNKTRFCLTERIPLQLLKYGTEYEIGLELKKAYQKLQDHIKNY